MSILVHRHQIKTGRDKSIQSLPEKTVDILMYVFAITGTLAMIPQLLRVWVDHNVSGVSLFTWIGFFLGSLFSAVYGIVHHQKPIIFASWVNATVQFLIIVGLAIRQFSFT